VKKVKTKFATLNVTLAKLRPSLREKRPDTALPKPLSQSQALLSLLSLLLQPLKRVAVAPLQVAPKANALVPPGHCLATRQHNDPAVALCWAATLAPTAIWHDDTVKQKNET